MFFCNLKSKGQLTFQLAFISNLLEGSLLYYKLPTYRHVNSAFGMTRQQYVCFSSKTAPAKKPEKKEPLSVKNTENILKKSAVLDSGSYLEELKVKLKGSRNKYSHVFDQSIAEKMVTTIMKHRINPFAPVLDTEAGPGLVSRELLKQGVCKVVALEINKDFSHILSTLQADVGSDKFCFFNWRMANLYLKLHSSSENESVQAFEKMESQVAELLLQSSSPDSEVPYSLLSIGGRQNNEHFVFYVLRNLPNEDPILCRGRPDLFFLVHPRFTSKIDYIADIKKTEAGASCLVRDKSEANNFGYIHAVVYLLYDITVIEQFSTNDVYPPLNSIKAKQDKGIDPSKRLLMRMQLKKNINEILPLQHHTPFMFFLQQMYKKKSLRTIPAMEMLIPGCGLRMLAEGFTMMDIIKMSNPTEMLKLYKIMLNWPEYVSSPLHSYLMLKVTGGMDDNSLSDEEQH